MYGINTFPQSTFVCFAEINTLLNMFHLKPPSVTVESVSTKKTFSCRVSVNLDKFIFQNNNDYTAKRDAIRETYLLFGNALGIAQELGNLLSGAAGMNEQPLTLQPPAPKALTKIQC